MSAPAARPMLVVGDSFSGEPNATDAAAGYRPWHALIGDELGLPVLNRAVPGAGHVATGNLGLHARRRFSQQLLVNPHPDPRLVVVIGSQNDAPANNVELTTTAFVTLHAALLQYPNARHLWVGPVWAGPGDPTAAVLRARDDVLQAVWGLPFHRWVDPLAEGWFPRTRPDLVGPDGRHPNAAGQRHMHERLLPHVRAVLA